MDVGGAGSATGGNRGSSAGSGGLSQAGEPGGSSGGTFLGGSGSGGTTGGATGGNASTGGGAAGQSGGGAGSQAAGGGTGGASMGRGFPLLAPWVSFYGAVLDSDVSKLASTFRVINIEADPDAGNVTPAQILSLKSNGANRVISYLDVGSCENYRSYWATSPSGFVGCKDNTAAQLGPYDGYPNETWMNVGNPDYQKLIVGYVAPRLAAQGVDGFFLDNLELVEHGTHTTNGPCDTACSQGGLDLVRMLREAFPALLIVMQNATSDVTRLGMTGGVSYPSLLDGISHEEVFAPAHDAQAEMELLAWKSLGLMPGGHAFFLGTEDYVGSCSMTAAAQAAYAQSTADGFSPYVSDASASMTAPCFWPWL